MNDTSKCWVIANFEMIIIGVTLLMGLLYALVKGGVMLCVGMGLQMLPLIAFLLAFTLPLKTFGFGIIKFGILFLGGCLVTFMDYVHAFQHDYTSYITIFWGVFLIGMILALYMSVFIHHHFHEVVSRRMLYTNSNIDMFSNKLKYVIDKCTSVSSSIVICSIWLYGMIVMANEVMERAN